MHIEFLGTGTSLGVPMIGCKCHVCKSSDTKDNRMRASLLIKYQGKNVVIDCGPDFRTQLLRAGVDDLESVIITHEHRDHIAGLDDVRSINYILRKSVELRLSEESLKAVKVEFPYIFNPGDYQGAPQIDLVHLDDEPFELNGLKFIPLKVMHRHMKVYGFRIGDFSYITDANYIPDETMAILKGTKIMVLNALRLKKHPSHFSLEEAIEIAQEIGAEKTYFTHLGHLIGKHEYVNPKLPKNMELAYDGLSFSIPYSQN
ncbi:MBL fold metallo-hydrolase [Lentimicrobium sp. L6]|nr:MBL fold metallo-hydrolase [Lentimicrobium sp. S6]NPD84159.1 MBL fold metallo-hydrolase [Lentimicrobium sp. L6]